MKISYNWLKAYIDLDEPAEVVGEWLTGTGLEVEHIEKFETIEGGLSGLIVGEVLTCVKHPNADRLSLTTVDIGGGKQAFIVCGAPNVAAGQKVIVALPGTTLYPTGKEPFTITSTKIRGEVSEGMICAEDEIGMGESHAGIIVLDTKASNGSPASSVIPVYTDTVFEIGLTPNRTDAFSHMGVARDIRALKGRALKWPSVEAFKTDKSSGLISVTVDDAEACPRYSSLILSDVKVGDSPQWLQNRLLAIGLTPINNVVDVTNFVCHELGQPLHAFDAAKITGKKVLVKTLPKGTSFVTLDGKTRTLSENDLMICDERGGLCIAGVFGGAASGITKDTTTVFLESAKFSAEYIRRTTLYHQLNTDASFRFARGTDPSLTVYALKRAALLLVEVAGATITSAVSDIYPHKVEPAKIKVMDKHLNRLVGKEFARADVKKILERLDINIVEEQSDHYEVAIPTYRIDVQQEADVVEEFLRIYGFNNIELSAHTRTDYIANFPVAPAHQVRQLLGSMLAANGFLEIWTNSLSNEHLHGKYSAALPGEPVKILNKLSEELGVMRQTLLFSMLEVCAYNLNRKQRSQKLFEFGKIYFRDGDSFTETERVGLLLTGHRDEPTWQRKDTPVGFFDAVQAVTQLLNRCGITEVEQAPYQSPLYDQGVTFTSRGKFVCNIGRVNSTVSQEFGIKQEIFHSEVDLSLLLKMANPMLVIRDVPKFPAVTRDLSLILSKDISFRQVMDLARETGKPLVQEVSVFDVYEGKNIPQDKKAYAITMTLLDPLKTLTEEEIDTVMQRLMNEFELRLGAVIRR